MKKTFKKSLALLLAAVMLFSASPIIGIDFSTPASAASESDLTFELINGGTEYEVSDCNEAAAGALTIPSTHDGKPVTSIGASAFNNCDDLTSVTVPDSVTSIGASAFYWCLSLESVTFAEGIRLECINDETFSFCKSLASITIPDSVKSIGSRAFYGCDSLESITINEGVTSIGNYAFSACNGIKAIIVAESNPNYFSENGVLFNKTKTKLLQYPAGKEDIAYTIPDGVVEIGEWAFEKSKLEALVIPASVERFGESALFGCDKLKTITVDEGNTSYSSLDGVLFNKDKTVLCKYSPANERTTYSVPESVIEIVDYAFDSAENLTTVNLPDGLKSIGNDAFCDCKQLDSPSIPLSVESVGHHAFYYTGFYHNAASWEDGLLYLDGWLLDVKFSVTQMNIKAGTRFIASGVAISNSTVESISIPTSVESIGDNAFNATAFLNNNSNWTDGILYIDNCLIKAKNTVSDVVIRPDTRVIADDAFVGCRDLTEVKIPESVNHIGERAFDLCYKLTGIIIPNPTTTIGNSAFNGVADNFVIRGYSDSAAETYADNNDITFEIIPSSVTLDITSKTLTVGATQQLTPTFAPIDGTNKDVIWSSSNEEIATVSATGLVTVISEGTATITVTTKYGGKTATCAITAIYVPVTGVTLDIRSKTLVIGATQQLAASVAPDNATNKEVTWESSDTAVATVNATGLVTAKAGGTATITVTTRNKSETATCAITVISPTVAINNNPGTKTINYGDELKLTAAKNNAPEGAVIVWYVDGTEKGRGDEFTAPAGTADYTVTVKLVNKDGNIIKDAEDNEITDEEDVTVKAGFFQKLISFFKNLFGAIRIVPQAFKQF